MKLIAPPIEISEEAGFDPEIDIFGRRIFGEALLNLIRNTEDELVLALDAPWGEGKSTFIKMWRGYLKSREVSYVYFDAFENDYQDDPFLAISSEIYQLIDDGDEAVNKEFREKATSALKVVCRASLRIGIKALTAGVLDETVFEETGTQDDVSEEASQVADKFIASQITKSEKDKKALSSFKEYLAQLGDHLGGDGHLIFIIDELDRCKPKFALSLIESIKHLFSVPNITFVLVMNREQLEEAVKGEYGAGVDATRYLQKFVSVWSSLPKSTDRYDPVPKKYLRSCLARMGFELKTRTHQATMELYEDLAIYYDLSLREIERSLTNFAIIHNATDGNLNSDYACLSVFISIIKVKDPLLYKQLASQAVDYKTVIEKADLSGFKADWWEGKPEGHPLKWLLKYFLGSEDEVNSLLEHGNYLESRIGATRDAIATVCKWLEAFQRS